MRHDGTVRDGNGEIIQLRYGGDGFSPDRCVPVTLKTSFLTEKAMEDWYMFAS